MYKGLDYVNKWHGILKRIRSKIFAGSAAGSIVCAVLFMPPDIRVDYYLDPGTLTILLQALVGGLVAGAVAMKMFWGRIKHFFSEIFSAHKSNIDDDQQ